MKDIVMKRRWVWGLGLALIMSYLLYLFQISGLLMPGPPLPTRHFSGYRNCDARTKVAFLKTHKCASSTVQNILMRRGLELQLNFVLPLKGHYLGKMLPFQGSMLKGSPWHQARLPYHIFAQHTRWNYDEVSRVLGHDPDTAYISIVRDPVQLFVSLWQYARMGSIIGLSLEQYIMLDQHTGAMADRAKTGNLGRNQMLWDFGLDPDQMDNRTAVQLKVQQLDAEFDLVMVAEQFDQSLVLLRHLLCWDFRHVTYFKLNARSSSAPHEPLSAEAALRLKKWLWADYLLYDHFKQKLQLKMEQFGSSRMAQDLAILRRANEQLYQRCVKQAVPSDQLPDEQHLWGDQLIGYQLLNASDELCQALTRNEVSFVALLKQTQAQRAWKQLNLTSAGDQLLLQDQPLPRRHHLSQEELEQLQRRFPHHRQPQPDPAPEHHLPP